MQRFAELLDRLVLTPARNGKLKLMTDYFREVEDPDRGWALAALTGDLTLASVKPAQSRQRSNPATLRAGLAWQRAWWAMSHWRWLWLLLAIVWLWLMREEISK